MKILKRTLLVVFILIFLGYWFACWNLSNRVLMPESNLEKTKNTIKQYWGTTFEAWMKKMPSYEEVFISGYHDSKIAIKYFTKSDSAQCAFIFSHGWAENWAGMLKYVSLVESCNCNYIFYDHRSHGLSDDQLPTGGLNEAKDLIEVTKWANTKGYNLKNIAWIGSSWGAATTIIAGADNKTNVGLIVADAPFRDWYSAITERAIEEYGSGIKLMFWGVLKIVNLRTGVNYKDASPNDQIINVEEPVLLFHSAGDKATNPNQSIDIAKGINNRSIFHLTQWGNDHVDDIIKNTEDIKNLFNQFVIKEANQFYCEPSLE